MLSHIFAVLAIQCALLVQNIDGRLYFSTSNEGSLQEHIHLAGSPIRFYLRDTNLAANLSPTRVPKIRVKLMRKRRFWFDKVTASIETTHTPIVLGKIQIPRSAKSGQYYLMVQSLAFFGRRRRVTRSPLFQVDAIGSLSRRYDEWKYVNDTEIFVDNFTPYLRMSVSRSDKLSKRTFSDITVKMFDSKSGEQIASISDINVDDIQSSPDENQKNNRSINLLIPLKQEVTPALLTKTCQRGLFLELYKRNEPKVPIYRSPKLGIKMSGSFDFASISGNLGKWCNNLIQQSFRK